MQCEAEKTEKGTPPPVSANKKVDGFASIGLSIP